MNNDNRKLSGDTIDTYLNEKEITESYIHDNNKIPYKKNLNGDRIETIRYDNNFESDDEKDITTIKTLKGEHL